MMKDYVKSVKGTDFPACFDSSYDDRQLDEYARRFQAMRGDLYVRGIVLKEYVELKRRDSMTNEYENGSWTVIETGDGQVSGLSPNQYVFKFYDEIRWRMCGNE